MFKEKPNGSAPSSLLESAVTASSQLNGLNSKDYFSRLVQILSELMHSDYAFVCELDEDATNAKTIAVWCDGELAPNFSYALDNTPCWDLSKQGICCFPTNVPQLFPLDPMLVDMGVQGYMGTVLNDRNGCVIGLMVTLYRAPIQHLQERQKILQVFDERAANELQRLRYEALLNEQIAKLREQNEQLRLTQHVYDHTADGIMVTDAQNRITSVNPAFSAITGFSAQDILGKDPRVLSSGRHDKTFFSEMWKHILEQESWQGELWNRHKDGDVYPVLQSISAVRDENERITSFISVFSNISALKEAESKLEYMAHHDPLTGLPNRTLFASHLDRALAYSRRHGNKAAVLVLDVDRFKLINDTLGHQAGDQLLIEIADRIRLCIRDEDTVARLGGDEFALILNELGTIEEAVQVAEKILTVIAQPMDICVKSIVSSASIGIGVFPDDASNCPDLIRAADTAMYRAKNRGRNTYEIYTSELVQRADERLNLETDLRRALQNDELALYFQPFVDIKTGRICGVETLLRWQHPERGMIMPDDFIPIAEESDLIDQIGNWVMCKALEQANEWEQKGLVLNRIAINVSGRQVLYGNLVESVRTAIEQRKEGGEKARLELEITENVMLSMDRSKDVFDQLKACGAMIAIDDFGTGFSSLSRLQSLLVDTVKIDRSFLADAPASKQSAGIVAAIVAMGKSLGLRVIAEGVETEEQFAFLQQLGCDEVQGYLLGRPVDAAATASLLRQSVLH